MKSHRMLSLWRFLNISHNYFITGIHVGNLAGVWISVCNMDGRHRHHLHLNFAKGGKWNDSSADIPGHTRPFLLIHFCAHWHVCCFIALLPLEHLLSVPKVEKTRRKRKKSAFFKIIIYIQIWLFFFFFCLKEMRLIVGIVRAQQVLMDTPKENSGDRQQ